MAGGSYVGLDIGSNLMKVAEVRRTGSGVEVTALGMAPTPPEMFDNSMIVDPQQLGQAVKALMKQAGVSARQCISSVSGQSAVVVRVIEVPQMNASELAETMKWEVERQVPFSSSEVIMDFLPIERPEGYAEGQNMEVLMAVAQQDMIDRHVEMLFAAGLKPVAIDVEPLAAGRTLLELGGNGAQPGYTVAIINIGASNTDIGIFRDKLLSFPRTLPLAGDNFTRAIADALQVDMMTAENYKRELGEVMFNQMQSEQPGFYGGGDFGGGFIDFGAQQPPEEPTLSQPSPFAAGGPPPASPFGVPSAPVPPSTPPHDSGRMPFDFSTSTEETPPAGATPFDLGGSSAPPPSAPFAPSGAAPHAANPFGAPSAEPAPFPPSAPPPSNLPVAVSSGTGDPAREALRVHIFNAIVPLLQELVQELRRSLDYYRQRSADAQIHEMLLVGGTAKLKNLAAFLESELGIPTRVANPLQGVQVSSKNYSSGHLKEIATLFPISVGLGARELITAPNKGKKRR